MEAEADGRLSLNRLTKRKTDGVYYTPEWVVRMIVDQTVGARLEDIKGEVGIGSLVPLDEAAIAEYRAYQADRRRTARVAAAQWRHVLRDTNITEAYDAKRLLKHLFDLRTTSDTPLRARILALDAEIQTLDQTIAAAANALNAIIYRLYRLTPAEIATVGAG